MDDSTMAELSADTAAIANDIANAIERASAGRSTVAVYLAPSMVLGSAAADAERPDFDGLMMLVRKVAREAFALRMKERG